MELTALAGTNEELYRRSTSRDEARYLAQLETSACDNGRGDCRGFPVCRLFFRGRLVCKRLNYQHHSQVFQVTPVKRGCEFRKMSDEQFDGKPDSLSAGWRRRAGHCSGRPKSVVTMNPTRLRKTKACIRKKSTQTKRRPTWANLLKRAPRRRRHADGEPPVELAGTGKALVHHSRLFGL